MRLQATLSNFFVFVCGLFVTDVVYLDVVLNHEIYNDIWNESVQFSKRKVLEMLFTIR